MKIMNNIIKAEDMPEFEKVYMKKSLGEWKVVYPIKNDDDSFNWFNLVTGGSWLKFFTILAIILLILAIAYEYSQNLSYCNKLIKERNDKELINKNLDLLNPT